MYFENLVMTLCSKAIPIVFPQQYSAWASMADANFG